MQRTSLFVALIVCPARKCNGTQYYMYLGVSFNVNFQHVSVIIHFQAKLSLTHANVLMLFNVNCILTPKKSQLETKCVGRNKR